jgi:hemerythrin
MSKLEWNESFSVNVKSMDEQHVRLVKMIGALDDAMLQGKGVEVLGRLFNGLIAYTVEHFKAEEELMRENDYPEFEEHRAKHEAMTAQVLKLQSEFRESKVAISSKVMSFLTDWLTKHIMGTDKKYGVYLNGIGVN